MTALMDVPVLGDNPDMPEILPEHFLENPPETDASVEVLEMSFLETVEEAEEHFRMRMEAEGILFPEFESEEKDSTAGAALRPVFSGMASAAMPRSSARVSKRAAPAPLSEAALRRKKMAKYLYYGIAIGIMGVIWLVLALSMGWL